MKSIFKKILIITLSLIILFPYSIVYADSETGRYKENYSEDEEENYDEEEYDEDYLYSTYKNEIDNCDIDIKVEDNNILKITENYQVHFNEEVHGLYRTIPLNSHIKRSDGSGYILRAKISDIEVKDEPFTCSRNISEEEIKIGDEDKLIEGDHEYTISYTYNLGNDRSRDFDEFYFNLIGSQWKDTVFKNVTFKITMPKDFNEDKIGFTAGKVNNFADADVYYEVNGNVITGEYSTPIHENEALTIRLQLPEGYFEYNPTYMKSAIIASIVIILLTAVVIIMRLTRGKKVNPIEPVVFYPPYGCNPIQIKRFYSENNIQDSDVSTLLIYLANKGYINIMEDRSKQKPEYIFTKLKYYNGTNKIEKIFMDKFFKHDNLIKGSDVGKNLYNAYQEICREVTREGKENPIFTKKSVKKLIVTWILTIVSSVFGMTMLCYNSGLGILGGILCGGFITAVASIMIFFLVGKEKYKHPSGWIILAIVSVIAFFIIYILSNLIYLDEANKLLAVIYVIAGIIDSYCIVGMKIRTEFSNKIYGEICGFRNFLNIAEKDKLEALVMQNPNYFFDILPYTYVLGVSDKWIKTFASIVTRQPDWYVSNCGFSLWNVHYCMDSMDRSMSQYVSSISSSSSGGSSGGGGVSGGGAGGGGGGSW